MNFRVLGRGGPEVSEISLGAMVFGWKTTELEAGRIIDAALDAGINLFDTSNSYGKGRSEEILGAALKGSKRSNTIVATKFNFWKYGDNSSGKSTVRTHIINQCHESLRRLRTDTVDLYQLHTYTGSFEMEEVLAALDELARTGKVRWTGTGTSLTVPLVESAQISKEKGLGAFLTDQVSYNLLDRSIERELLPLCSELGLGVLCYCPLAEGLLTGKYKRGELPPSDSRFAQATDQKGYMAKLTPEVFDTIDKLQLLADEKNVPLSSVALGWCRSRPGISSFLVGPSSLLQLQANLRDWETPLEKDDLARLDEICPREVKVTS